MRSSGMQEALTIIEKSVEYLLNHKAMKKLNQWFLADDSNFNDITAERYVINYLMKQNTNISDNLYKSGTDAYLKHASSCVGVEVTTLNGFFGEWILYGCGSSRTTPLYHLISRRWVPLVVCCDGGAGIGTFPLA